MYNPTNTGFFKKKIPEYAGNLPGKKVGAELV
jgi:hypothetical protein